MLLAYADESGDSGPIERGGSLTYAVGCVLVPDSLWPGIFDGLIAFRRRLHTRFGIPVRAEIKATYLVGGSGPLRPLKLAPAERGLIFRAHLGVMSELGIRGFAVIVDKRDTEWVAPDALAWEMLLERLERTSHYEKTSIMLTHDNGDNLLVRKTARKARRRITAGSAYGTGQIKQAAKLLIDDPIPRDSSQSYMVQLADLTAYAAFRTLIPPGKSVVGIVPQHTWANLGSAVHTKVNFISGGTPGIVVRKVKGPPPQAGGGEYLPHSKEWISPQLEP